MRGLSLFQGGLDVKRVMVWKEGLKECGVEEIGIGGRGPMRVNAEVKVTQDEAVRENREGAEEGRQGVL